MGDLEPFLPQQSKTVEAIYDAWKKRGDSEAPRGYLGASIIGAECSRALWYGFRWCGREDFSGRMYRLFDRGNIEETRQVEDLRAIGCTVHAVDENGDQFAVTFAEGHGGGHLDGCILGVLEAPKTWHIYEGKTYNTKWFRRLTQSKSVQQTKPMHYDQMQVYMRLTGMDRALYMATNKDTDELYSERVPLDITYADSLLAKAERIVKASEPPVRAGEDPSCDTCKYCAYTSLCFDNPAGRAVPADVTCRSCAYSVPIEEGRWHCSGKEKCLSKIDQSKACTHHLTIPGLITFAEPVDYGVNPDGSAFVEYMNESDNATWRHGPNKEDGQFDSWELTKTPVSALHGKGGERIKHFKKKIAGEVVG